MISETLRKTKKAFKDHLTSIMLQDHEKPLQSGMLSDLNERFGLHSLAAYLPYESYDETLEVYYCKEIKGIVVEANPMAGAGDENIESFYAFIQRILPEGAILHSVLYASPYIGPTLDAFLEERTNPHPLIQRLAEKRVAYYKKGVYQPLIAGEQTILRDYKLIISLVLDNRLELTDSTLVSLKNSLLGALKTAHMTARILTPASLMQRIESLLAINGALYEKNFHWNELDTIAHQLGARASRSRIQTPSKIFLYEDGSEGEWQIRNYRISHFKKHHPHLSEMSDLIGNLFDTSAQIGCPFSLSFIIQICVQAREKGVAETRAFRALQRAEKLARHSEKAVNDAKESRAIVKALDDKERIVKVSFQVSLYCKTIDAERQEASLFNVFQASSMKWELNKNYLTQLVMQLAHLPLGQSDALMKDLTNLSLTYKLWASDAANMLPIVAETKGMNSHRFMLAGRRGQVLFWDPFGNLKANYNTCVAGISGAGKSVTVQEMASGLIGTNARVWIIDVGRSYKKLCHLLNGQFIEFNNKTKLCLNPFTTVKPEEFKEFIGFMTPFVASMVNPNQEVESIEMAFIEQSIKAVWDENGNQGSITDIANWLLAHSDQRAKDLGTILYPYTLHGQYGEYFNGKANIDFDNPLVVFELEEINYDKRLQSVIFMLLMYHVTEKMYLGGRKIQMALVIDEAWDMLKGGQGGKIIESIARRARKYGGSLITITQSIADYFASNAGLSAYKNSYWKIIQMQDRTDVQNLVKEEKLSLTPFQVKLLCSVTTLHGVYSEIMILGGGGECAVGRLLLDPYSNILYSTQAEEYAAVNELCQQGIPLVDAIGFVAERKYLNV